MKSSQKVLDEFNNEILIKHKNTWYRLNYIFMFWTIWLLYCIQTKNSFLFDMIFLIMLFSIHMIGVMNIGYREDLQ